VVHPDAGPGHGEVFFQERFDLVPVPSGKPAADAWHVDGRSLVDLACQLGQAVSERVVADRDGICSRAAALFAELRYLFPCLYARA
jgi:hypothetical protein